MHSPRSGQRGLASFSQRRAFISVICGAVFAAAVSGCSDPKDGGTATTAAPTAAIIPSEVIGLKATLEGTTASLTWAAPAGVDGLTGYGVYVTQAGPITVGPGVTSYEVPDLEPGRKYLFQVTTLTDGGPSFPAEAYLDVPFSEIDRPAPQEVAETSPTAIPSQEAPTRSADSSAPPVDRTIEPTAEVARTASPTTSESAAFPITGTVTLAWNVNAGEALDCGTIWKSPSIEVAEEHGAFETYGLIQAPGKVVGSTITYRSYIVYTCSYEFVAIVSGDSEVYEFSLSTRGELVDQDKFKTSDLRSGRAPTLNG